ncbi:hypothetical protein R1sor_019765 [Riccia sorocarpa]|uniref:Radical S-adenosyl methionine domain-containing protein 1, mitochondrial n=1 Tax=Riccia sorocarpa TaxID=122646 RepID=A0ABD3IDF6_9MARC
MSSSCHLTLSLSFHLHPKLAGVLANSRTASCRRFYQISSCFQPSVSYRSRAFPRVLSLSSQLIDSELRGIIPARRQWPSLLYDSSISSRNFSIGAVAGPPPSLNPSSNNLIDSYAVGKELTADNSLAAPTSAYIHIPFCRRRCFYCDFTIVAVGERTDRTADHHDLVMRNYVDILCKEIAATARKRMNGGYPPLETVFFGGGTPSLLPVPLFARIINEVQKHFQISAAAEIAVEMDPGTFDTEKLKGFLDCGVSRVSLGVQSFQADLLSACGRAHGLREVYDAIAAIHSAGLQNWSLDLIASLPNQTMPDWEHSLQETVNAAPAHVSVYDLQIEEGTLFNQWYKAGETPLPSDDRSAEFYRRASLRLQEAGYEHYEVSNYAKPGFQCRHNLVYWENRPYFAFGLGSTSYVEGRRFSRPKKMREYLKYVDSLEISPGSLNGNEYPVNSVEDRILDTVMLSLRLARGLNLREFEQCFGLTVTSTVCCRLVEYIRMGLVEALDSDRRLIPVEEFIELYSCENSDDSRNVRRREFQQEFGNMA